MTEQEQPIIDSQGWEDTAAEGQRNLRKIKGAHLTLSLAFLSKWLGLDLAADILSGRRQQKNARRG